MSNDFAVRIEPGGHLIRVPPGENVLAAALAAGLPLPYSCRAGRCASCKARLLSGRIEYPEGTPPGITAQEVARGEVLLCQARPRSDLQVEARRIPVRESPAARYELVSIQPISLGALRLRLQHREGGVEVRPGQFVDLRNSAGDLERLPVVAVDPGFLEVEAIPGDSPWHRWLATQISADAMLRVTGPFAQPR